MYLVLCRDASTGHGLGEAGGEEALAERGHVELVLQLDPLRPKALLDLQRGEE